MLVWLITIVLMESEIAMIKEWIHNTIENYASK